MRKKLNVSVREIAEFALAQGDINTRAGFGAKESAIEGTLIHSRFQQSMLKEHGEDSFRKEYYVEDKIGNSEVLMSISGRIDGVLTVQESGIEQVYIYEVKTTYKDINEISPSIYPEHLGQAQCYAYMYCMQHNLDNINIRLLYINRENKDQITYEYALNIEELSDLYENIAGSYLKWLTSIRKWQIHRNYSISKLQFPFTSQREGQKTLMDETYNCIKDRIKLYVSAPTGIGKTMGVLFPSIKALGEGLVDKLMYLTAKTVTGRAALDAYKILQQSGLNLRLVSITAKDKICPYENRDCDPEKCPKAKGYLLRAKSCLSEMLNEQYFDRDIIVSYADKHNICPFELSLDLTRYCDLIVCDYNYLFDPRIQLQRYFDGQSNEKFCFIIDEAHNLVERGREMFSCSINLSDMNTFKRSLKKEWKSLKADVNEIIAYLKKLSSDTFDISGPQFDVWNSVPEELVFLADQCVNQALMYDLDSLTDEAKKDFLDGLFNLIYYTRVAEFYDRRYATLISNPKDISVKMMCLDPSLLLKESLDMGAGSILFSATLEPSIYYMDLLGADHDMDVYLSLDSPFPRENLEVKIAAGISTKYRDRDMSYGKIAKLLEQEFTKRTGNYMVFFPSYAYMQKVISIFQALCPHIEILEQKTYMSEQQREDFLKRFDEYGNNTLVAFAVMGGLFGEGIDLGGEKLSGVAVVGPGLPMVGPERELIKQYFDSNDMNGFDYSYTYPGMNRVLQAAGRVIRGEEDKGFVLLIDSRFSYAKYKSLFPKWWNYSNI